MLPQEERSPHSISHKLKSHRKDGDKSWVEWRMTPTQEEGHAYRSWGRCTLWKDGPLNEEAQGMCKLQERLRGHPTLCLCMGLLILSDVRESSARWFFPRLLPGVVPTRGEDPEAWWMFSYAFVRLLRFTRCPSLSAGINLRSSLKFGLCWFVVWEKHYSFNEKYCWCSAEEQGQGFCHHNSSCW